MQGGQGYTCDLLAGTFIYRKLNLLYLNQDRRPDGSTPNELVRIYNRSYFGLLARPELKQECHLVEKLVTFEQTLL